MAAPVSFIRWLGGGTFGRYRLPFVGEQLKTNFALVTRTRFEQAAHGQILDRIGEASRSKRLAPRTPLVADKFRRCKFSQSRHIRAYFSPLPLSHLRHYGKD